MLKNDSLEFQQGLVQKTYLGILRGQLKPPKGQWSDELTDKGEGRQNPAGLKASRVPCLTRYSVIEATKYFSYCQFDLITGRQHQIRKHATLNNHSLVGDTRYGDKKYNKKISDLYKTERMFLHCLRIEILDFVFESMVPKSFDSLLHGEL